MVQQLRRRSPDDVGVAIITIAELWFGAKKGARPGPTRREVDAFLRPFEVFLFDAAGAEVYAEFRLGLERRGRPIGERDLLIASIAAARGLIVVTHNTSEFARVPGLQIEDWV